MQDSIIIEDYGYTCRACMRRMDIGETMIMPTSSDHWHCVDCALPVMPQPASPKLEMREFTRSCGHTAKYIWAVGDEAQAEHYRSTACQACYTPMITFARGWGRTR